MCYNAKGSVNVVYEWRFQYMYQSALILEGGGMRGLFTSGVLDYFMDKEVEFKKIYAVSAGTGNACNYLSKQRGRAYTINTKYRGDKHFASMRSLITTGDYFGKEFQLKTIPNELYPFDYETFAENNTDFYAVATNCSTGEAEYFKVERLPEDMEYIWASSSLPLLSRLVDIHGEIYLDGGVSDSVPIVKSLRDGNKKNVIVLTRDITYRKEPNKMIPVIEKKYRDYPKLVEAVRRRHIIYNRTLEFIEKHEKAGHIFVIRPQERVKIGRLEKDEKKLKELYEMGYHTAEMLYGEMVKYLTTPYRSGDIRK